MQVSILFPGHGMTGEAEAAPGEAGSGAVLHASHGPEIPKHYLRMEVKYTRFEDFDFHPYNFTNFAGLESASANAYCNANLQVRIRIR